ncbi:hypothetical protein [Chitinophaga rhizophila]|uniref:Uncharacterized protein n=1 Tax=Chitinophaga rhizophila TaxID=2866212 RepID=A0ABS7G7S6_9BACT|nr:hypothetical protein [Chitinophaga rhizophila]MBW8683712.1 hypothetical protein [Chitinophaga rhizophila]
MFRQYFLTGLAAGILSGLAAFFYSRIYTASIAVNFTQQVSPPAIFSACLFAGMLITLLYYTMYVCYKKAQDIPAGILLVLFTFAGMTIPFMTDLPLDAAQPELFPGLVVPMQLFPTLAWFAVKPFFNN